MAALPPPSRPNTPSEAAHRASRTVNVPQNIYSQLPWHIAMQVRLGAFRAELWRTVHIFAVETHNLPRRIKIQLLEIRYLPLARTEGISLAPDRPDSSTWKPSSSEYTKQVVAQRPWASLYDLSLCHQGWQAAIESLRYHIQGSGTAPKGTQTSDSRNP
jgi:hypothetical protein